MAGPPLLPLLCSGPPERLLLGLPSLLPPAPAWQESSRLHAAQALLWRPLLYQNQGRCGHDTAWQRAAKDPQQSPVFVTGKQVAFSTKAVGLWCSKHQTTQVSYHNFECGCWLLLLP